MGSFGKEKTMADFRLNDCSVELLDGKMKRFVASEDDRKCPMCGTHLVPQISFKFINLANLIAKNLV